MTPHIQAILASTAMLMAVPAGPTLAQNASANCRGQIAQLEIFSEKLRENEKRAQSEATKLADSHPLVVKLADGRIVDLSGEEELSKPLESWIKAVDVSRKADRDLKAARKLQETSSEDDCLKLLEPYQFNRS